MTIKYADDVIEKFDTDKTLGTLNYLDTILVHRWEDYVDEAGEEKRRETDDIESVDVKLYSSSVNGDITVTVPPEAKVAKMTAEKNYNEEVTLVAPTARFWSSTDIVNDRRVVTSGVKIRATDIVPSRKSDQPKKEG